MKNKLFFLTIVVAIALLVTPSTALAYSGVTGTVENTAGDPWLYGGRVLIVNASTGLPLGGWQEFTGSTFNIAYPSPPGDGHQIMIVVSPNTAPEGKPDDVTAGPLTEVSSSSGYLDFGTIVVNSGPTLVQLVDFSVSSQSNGNLWLPLVMLIGSIILLGSALLIRKRRAQSAI